MTVTYTTSYLVATAESEFGPLTLLGSYANKTDGFFAYKEALGNGQLAKLLTLRLGSRGFGVVRDIGKEKEGDED